jgi:hypothetical protein
MPAFQCTRQIASSFPAWCRDCETRYLVRTLVSNLRVGANWRSVIGALARATLLHVEPTRPTKVPLPQCPFLEQAASALPVGCLSFSAVCSCTAMDQDLMEMLPIFRIQSLEG